MVDYASMSVEALQKFRDDLTEMNDRGYYLDVGITERGRQLMVRAIDINIKLKTT